MYFVGIESIVEFFFKLLVAYGQHGKGDDIFGYFQSAAQAFHALGVGIDAYPAGTQTLALDLDEHGLAGCTQISGPAAVVSAGPGSVHIGADGGSIIEMSRPVTAPDVAVDTVFLLSKKLNNASVIIALTTDTATIASTLAPNVADANIITGKRAIIISILTELAVLEVFIS